MRLAGQAKAGFYPADPLAVDLALARLTLADKTALTPVLDPCAGQGDALARLVGSLDVPPECVYAIELDEGRGARLKELLCPAVPPENVLAPASFEGTRLSHGAFSFIWCNPPYDDEFGGGRRCEYSFLQRCTALLRPHGILALAVPERIAKEDRDVTRQLAMWYTRLSVRPFPASVRHYDEVIVLGERRRQHVEEKELKQERWYGGPTLIDWLEEDAAYVIPPGDRPAHFEKVEYTAVELTAAMAKSPLRRLLQPPPARQLPSPPLALGTGHIALLLAAGHLDGLVRPAGETPHVVRGTASKVKYLASKEERDNANGSVTAIEKWNEKITLTVRAVAADGTIHTFTQE